MRYLLVLGFTCKFYRREPQARIYLNDQLIDDFHIPCEFDGSLKSMPKYNHNIHILKPNTDSKNYNLWIQNLPPLKFYELEIDKKIKNVTLLIKINNADSNYTNGFITNSTLIKLRICYFFPLEKKVLLRLDEIKNKNIISKNYSWYKSDKNKIFDLATNGMCWKGLNEQIFETPHFPLQFIDIGGDGMFLCHLYKKYGIIIPKLLNPSRYNFSSSRTNYFFDKYQQYENQRNPN